MILPFLLALLAFLAVLPILVPLLRGSRPVPARASFDQAVYRDQLGELDREIARGLLTQTDADAARLEIQRRLLASDQVPARPSILSRSPIVAALVFVVVGFGSVGGYLWLGAPGVPDEPFASRPAVAANADASEHATLQEETAQLEDKLRQNPSDPEGWLLYGRSLAMLNQWDKSAEAYQHAIDLGDKSPDVAADRAEMLVMGAGGTVTPAAEDAFKQVLKADPRNGLARFYLATAAAQAGEPLKAIDGWQALLADMPSDSSVRSAVGQRIAEAAKAAGIPVPELSKGTAPAQPEAAAPGPDAKAMADAASLPQDQRDAMIRGMVEKLAAKQQAEPGNLEGWLRLGQAYAVLHEPGKATDAFDKAITLKPDDVSIPLQAARALLTDLKPPEKIPAQAITYLKRAQASAPQEPMVLWYLGIAAAQDGHLDEARRDWNTLLARLPAGGEDAKLVQSALDALPPR
nr:c-type cytochrome biogenesis protein CcmI [uncultured Rhodopila sp.]